MVLTLDAATAEGSKWPKANAIQIDEAQTLSKGGLARLVWTNGHHTVGSSKLTY
jgi:hypothetical protein